MQLPLPELTADVRETPHQTDHLASAAYIDARAYGAKEERSEQKELPGPDARHMLQSAVQTWAGLVREGELIGVSFGDA